MRNHRIYVLIAAWLVAGVLMLAVAEEKGGEMEFSRTTIDVGIVVSDIQKAAEFYTRALGFAEAGSFDVSAQMAGDTGLTDSRPFQVRVFALGEEPTATKLKIMEIPGAESKRVDNRYIGSSLGLSYLTVFVSDLGKAMERLKQHSVAPVKEPYSLGGNNYLILVKDPDGNIIELIGPKQ